MLETFEKSPSTTVAPSSESSTVSVADPPAIESADVHSALSISTVEVLEPSLTSTSPESIVRVTAFVNLARSTTPILPETCTSWMPALDAFFPIVKLVRPEISSISNEERFEKSLSITLPDPEIERVSEPRPPAMVSELLNLEVVTATESSPLPESTLRFVDKDDVVTVSLPSPANNLKDLLVPQNSIHRYQHMHKRT